MTNKRRIAKIQRFINRAGFDEVKIVKTSPKEFIIERIMIGGASCTCCEPTPDIAVKTRIFRTNNKDCPFDYENIYN